MTDGDHCWPGCPPTRKRLVDNERAAGLEAVIERLRATNMLDGAWRTIVDLLADRAADAATIADRDRTIAELRAEASLLRASLTEADYEQAKLRAALEPFAREAETWSADLPDDYEPECIVDSAFKVGDLRRARDLVRTK